MLTDQFQTANLTAAKIRGHFGLVQVLLRFGGVDSGPIFNLKVGIRPISENPNLLLELRRELREAIGDGSEGVLWHTSHSGKIRSVHDLASAILLFVSSKYDTTIVVELDNGHEGAKLIEYPVCASGRISNEPPMPLL